MRIYFTYLLAAFATCLWGQPGPGSNWHFGQGNALSFNTGEPLVVTGSAQSTFEGCASISSLNGTLLFYTNGGGRNPISSGQSSGKIWNVFNEVIYDMGFTEGGGFSAAQSSVFVPKPSGGSRYYLFTMEEIEYDVGGSVPGQPLGRGLSFFELDAAANGGSGAVVAGPQIIFTPAYEALCAVKHSNGQNYWILINDATNGGLKIFEVSTAGVQASGDYFPNQAGSYIKGSPDRRWIAMTANGGGVRLMSFDAATGVPQTPLLLDDIAAVNTLEFSASGKYLYIVSGTTNGFIVGRYDLTSTDIAASFEVVNTNTSFTGPAIVGQMQVAVNQHLYFVAPDAASNSTMIFDISCVESAEPSVNLAYVYGGPSGDLFFGLPNFDNSLFYVAADSLRATISPQVAYVCENRPATLAASAAGATGFAWSTGESTATIVVSNPGDYSVTVTDACGNQGVAQITVNDGPSAGQAAPLTYYCATDTGLVVLADLLSNEDSIGAWIEISLAPSTPGAFDAANGLFRLDGQLPGLYSFRYSIPPVGPCLSSQAVVRIRIGPPITAADVQLAPLSCEGQTDGAIRVTSVRGGTAPFEYALQDQPFDTLQLFTGLPAGTYPIRIRDRAGCSWDSTLVLEEPLGIALDISPDQTLFRGESTSLQVSATPTDGVYTYTWSPPDGLSCTDCAAPDASPEQTTLYQVLVREAKGCIDSAEVLVSVLIPQRVFVPNAFSPNEDGLNDNFTVFSDAGVFEVESLQIFDRWGEQVFARNNFAPNELSLGWNGKFRGEPALSGVYVFLAVVVFDDGARERYQGNFSLIR